MTKKKILLFALFMMLIPISGCVSDDDKKLITKELNQYSQKVIGVKPKKISYSKFYATEGGGINGEMTFTDKQISENSILKNNSNIKNNKMKFYILLGYANGGYDDNTQAEIQEGFTESLGLSDIVNQFRNDEQLPYEYIRKSRKIDYPYIDLTIDLNNTSEVKKLLNNKSSISKMSTRQKVDFIHDFSNILITITYTFKYDEDKLRQFLQDNLIFDKLPASVDFKLYDKNSDYVTTFKMTNGVLPQEFETEKYD